MEKSSKNLAIILVAIIVISALILVYYFFLRPGSRPMSADGLMGEAGPLTSLEGLSSQVGRELLFLLDDLNSISFETDLIKSEGYHNLTDYSREPEEQVPGRENPFAPIQ